MIHTKRQVSGPKMITQQLWAFCKVWCHLRDLIYCFCQREMCVNWENTRNIIIWKGLRDKMYWSYHIVLAPKFRFFGEKLICEMLGLNLTNVVYNCLMNDQRHIWSLFKFTKMKLAFIRNGKSRHPLLPYKMWIGGCRGLTLMEATVFVYVWVWDHGVRPIDNAVTKFRNKNFGLFSNLTIVH